MSNQLHRFQNVSETRWPLPELPEEASGGNRKALSRYIGQCIARLEARDATLRAQRLQTAPQPVPESWQLPGGGGSGGGSGVSGKVRMGRKEYIKKQNALYRQLTGETSYAAASEAESQRDAQNPALMASLELYMAALDEKIYISADHARAMLGMRDDAVRQHLDDLRARQQADGERTPFLYALVELRDMYRDLWMQHHQLSNQRDALEVEAANLRYDQALQLGKVNRLQYATHCLGRKLVDAQKLRSENDELRQQLQQQQQQIEQQQQQQAALQQKFDAQQELMRRMAGESDARAPREVEARIHVLFEEVTRLRAASSSGSSENSSAGSADSAGSSSSSSSSSSGSGNTPLDELAEALHLVEILKTDAETRVSSLVQSFAQQHRAREQELLASVATLGQEKQILLARYDKLEQERDATVKDLAFLEERTLSLVYLLKTARASLDGMEDAER